MRTIISISFLYFLQICQCQILLSKWSFDNSSNSPDTGQGIISTAGGVTFSSYVAGNPSTGKAFGTNNYPLQSKNNERAGIHIRQSTRGYQDIHLRFDQYKSNTSSKKTMIFVSSDDSNFIKVDSLLAISGSSWDTKIVDLKSVPDLNNKSEIHILLVSSFVGSQYAASSSGSSYSTSGTWRFDNIMIYGTDTSKPKIKPKLFISSDQQLLSESNLDTVDFIFKLSDSLKYNLKNKVNFSGIRITSGDFMWLGQDTLRISKGSLSDTLQIRILDDLIVEGLETGWITIDNLDTNIILDSTISLTLKDDDIQSIPISMVQGNGISSTFVNSVIAIEGVVTADLQKAEEQGGFYMQDTLPDGDSLSSEGIFVEDIDNFQVEEGDLIKVTGKVIESFGQTVISQVSSIKIISKHHVISPVNIQFPIDSIFSLERFEGMKVIVNQMLTVSENFELGRYGEITASVNGRLYHPSNFIDPNDSVKEGHNSSGTFNVKAIHTQQSLNNRSQILICDKLSIQNPDPIPFIDTLNHTLRCGSTIDTLIAVLGYDYGAYRLYPSAGHPKIKYAVRPAFPIISNFNLLLAGMNVLNYFNGDGKGAGFPASRGAYSLKEFQRQKSKLITAIREIDADILGIMEIENDGDTDFSAIHDLVTSINLTYGKKVYDYIRDSKGTDGNSGTDLIKVALIYKPSALTNIGPSKSYMDSTLTLSNRPPLAQTFTLKSNGEKFTVIVNHFKSRNCADLSTDSFDKDQKDGQGCFNSMRKKQASSLKTFIQALIMNTNDSDILLIGDFNAYREEDPIDMLSANGLKSMLNETYTYLFDAQAGAADYGFATPSLFNSVTGAAIWHINSDEPQFLDYKLRFKTQDFYESDAYRSSDHDPFIAGLNLVKKLTTVVDNNSNEKCKIYPQPNDGNFTIDLSHSGASNIKIFALSGKLVYDKNLQDGLNRIGTALPAGLYYIIIEGKENIMINKLLILNK